MNAAGHYHIVCIISPPPVQSWCKEDRTWAYNTYYTVLSDLPNARRVRCRCRPGYMRLCRMKALNTVFKCGGPWALLKQRCAKLTGCMKSIASFSGFTWALIVCKPESVVKLHQRNHSSCPIYRCMSGGSRLNQSVESVFCIIAVLISAVSVSTVINKERSNKPQSPPLEVRGSGSTEVEPRPVAVLVLSACTVRGCPQVELPAIKQLTPTLLHPVQVTWEEDRRIEGWRQGDQVMYPFR